jgi:hypothetical protein
VWIVRLCQYHRLLACLLMFQIKFHL